MSTVITELERSRSRLLGEARQITVALSALRTIRAFVNGNGHVSTNGNGSGSQNQTVAGRAQISASQKAYWGRMTPSERSAEGIRRLKVAAKRGGGLFNHTKGVAQ